MAETIHILHDWSKQVIERISYLTDVPEVHSGKEYRARLRTNPRRSYGYYGWTSLIADENEQARLRLFHQAKMSRNFGTLWDLPIWVDYQTLDANYSISSTVINVDTQYRDFATTGRVLLFRNYLYYEIVTIQSQTTSSITLVSGTTKAWSKGDIIVPIRKAYPGQEQFSGIRMTNTMEMHDQLWDIQVQDNVAGNRISGSAAATLDTYEIYLKKTEFSDDQNLEYFNPLRRLDSGTGIFSISPRYTFGSSPEVSYAKERITFNFLSKTKQELSEFFGFLDRRKGRLNPFYYPTWSNDFQITNSGNSAATTIIIKYCGYSTYFYPGAGNLQHRVMFQTPSGTNIFRQIATATDNGDGTETLTINSGLGISWDSTTFSLISILQFMRLDQDMIELQYETTSIAKSGLTFVTCAPGGFLQ